MKTKIFHTALFALLSIGGMFAQDVTTVRAKSDISDNLDLKAVASIFGDSRDLEDFERRLNDPDIQISNLDLNGDNRVDYLRVIEVAEGNTHVIILQSVLGVDTFQDVATIEIERDRNNNVQVQVVGDVYIYGTNYIYEPVYVTRPLLFDVFWVSSYRPYYSPWYWGYYPRYYSYWAPYPIYRYRNNCHVHINTRNTYAYVNTGRSNRAVSMYNGRRSNDYERQNPGRSFSTRNNGVANRHVLEQNRGGSRSQSTTGGTRSSFSNNSTRSTSPNSVRNTNINTVRSNSSNATRGDNNNAVRNSSPSRSLSTPSRSNEGVRSAGSTPSRSNNNTVRSAGSTRSEATPARSNSSFERNNTPSVRSQGVPSRSNSSMSAPSRSNSSMGSSSRSSSPSMSPSRSSGSSVRSTPSAPSRQSSPAPSRSGGGNSGGRSRG